MGFSLDTLWFLLKNMLYLMPKLGFTLFHIKVNAAYGAAVNLAILFCLGKTNRFYMPALSPIKEIAPFKKMKYLLV